MGKYLDINTDRRGGALPNDEKKQVIRKKIPNLLPLERVEGGVHREEDTNRGV